MRRSARGRPGFEWAVAYAKAFEITTAGFMVGSFFLNRGHFDLIYHWVALCACLNWVYTAELRKAEEEEEAVPSRAVARRPEGEIVEEHGSRAPPSSPRLPSWSRTS